MKDCPCCTLNMNNIHQQISLNSRIMIHNNYMRLRMKFLRYNSNCVIIFLGFLVNFCFVVTFFITLQRYSKSKYLKLPSSSSLESLRRRDILQIQSKKIHRRIKEQNWAATLSRFWCFCISGMSSPISDRDNSYHYSRFFFLILKKKNQHAVNKLFGS